MKLYLLTQTVNNGYDTYDSCIVAAKTEQEARQIHPSGYNESWGQYSYTWARTPNQVAVLLIGTAVSGTKQGVILASFNAG